MDAIVSVVDLGSPDRGFMPNVPVDGQQAADTSSSSLNMLSSTKTPACKKFCGTTVLQMDEDGKELEIAPSCEASMNS